MNNKKGKIMQTKWSNIGRNFYRNRHGELTKNKGNCQFDQHVYITYQGRQIQEEEKTNGAKKTVTIWPILRIQQDGTQDSLS